MDGGLDGDDLEVEIDLRAPRDVAERAVLLGAVLRRVALDTVGGESSDETAEDRFDLATWIRTEGLGGATTEAELGLLDAPIGGIDAEDVKEATWQAEGLVFLAWALGAIEAVPAYDAPADPTAVLAALPEPWESVRPFVETASLRDEEAVAIERERAELWLWRARAEAAVRAATAADRAEYRGEIVEVARDANAAALLPALADGDFPVASAPFRSVSSARLDELAAVAVERLRAANWLCGFGRTWDDVPTET